MTIEEEDDADNGLSFAAFLGKEVQDFDFLLWCGKKIKPGLCGVHIVVFGCF